MNTSIKTTATVSLILALAACGGGSSGGSGESTVPEQEKPDPPTDPERVQIDFVSPRPVQILGYSGHAMEPHISRDGELLFFNNLNADTLDDGSENDTNIHYAIRNDVTTFQYMGPVVGASEDAVSGTNELEGVASLSNSGELYFIRTTDYLDANSSNYLKSVFSGTYANGNVINIQSLPNFKNDRLPGESPVLGELVFDVDIHESGSELYFSAGNFDAGILKEANLGVAIRGEDGFSVSADSASQMVAINTDALEYAATVSTDFLELYFSRAVLTDGEYQFGIFVSTRDDPASPWAAASRLASLTGEIAEAPSLSGDGEVLYFHQKIEGVFQVFVADRKE